MTVDMMLMAAMALSVGIAALFACAIWPGDARGRLVSIAWFLFAWSPFPLGVALQFGQDISALPISALTVGGLSLVAGMIFIVKPRRPFPRVARGIAAASFSVWLGMITCDLIAGSTPSMRALSGGIGMIVILLTLDSTRSALVGLRAGLASVCVVSVVFGLTSSAAWFLDSERFPVPIEPPFPGRLQGVAFQPNHLGQIAGLLTLLALLGPSSRWSRLPWAGLGVIVMLYTGSRSSMLGLFAAAAIVLLIRNSRSIFWWFGTVVGLGAIGVVLDQSSTEGGNTDTFNGREVIWQAVNTSFDKHPLFGVGPGGWEQLAAAYHLPPYASHAHNQIYDILGKEGLFGIAILAIWLVVTTATIVRLPSERRALPAAIVGFVAGRSVFEVPLDVYWFSLGTMVVATLCASVSWIGEEPAPEEAEARSNATRGLPHSLKRHEGRRRLKPAT